MLGRKREKMWKGFRAKGGKDLTRERGHRILGRNRDRGERP